MKREEFHVGATFYTGAGAWICTDVGNRVIVGVEKRLLDERPAGPPYEWAESIFDEYDQEGCSLSPDEFEQQPDWKREDLRDHARWERASRFEKLGLATNPDPFRPDKWQANIALAKEIAEHYGLSFHIANGTLETHAGYKSEERGATEEELALWRLVEMDFHRIG